MLGVSFLLFLGIFFMHVLLSALVKRTIANRSLCLFAFKANRVIKKSFSS